MKEIIIVGAGGLGRELLQWIKDINKSNPTWIIKGFIDDNTNALDGLACDYKIIGTISEWQPSENEVFAMAVAKPSTKELISEKLISRGAQFETIIHPRALVSEYAEIGEGSVLYPNCILGPNCKVGKFQTLLSPVGHDAVLGDYCTISSNCDICGHARLGNRVFMGSHSSVIPSRHIGDDVYIGAGSIVISHVKSGKTVFGNPAKSVDI